MSNFGHKSKGNLWLPGTRGVKYRKPARTPSRISNFQVIMPVESYILLLVIQFVQQNGGMTVNTRELRVQVLFYLHAPQVKQS